MSIWVILTLAGWSLVPLLAVGSGIVARRALVREVELEPCIECGYDLRGVWRLAPCCPECGHARGGHAVVASRGDAVAEVRRVSELAVVWWLIITLTALGCAITLGLMVLGLWFESAR